MNLLQAAVTISRRTQEGASREFTANLHRTNQKKAPKPKHSDGHIKLHEALHLIGSLQCKDSFALVFEGLNLRCLVFWGKAFE